MNKSKFHLLATMALIVVLITAILACGSPATAAAPTPEVRYAIYLSPYHQGAVPYGGYHVTIARFDNTAINVNTVRSDWLAANNGDPTFSFLNNPSVVFKESKKKVEYLGNTYVIGYKATFRSPTLTQFAEYLKKDGVKGIVGPRATQSDAKAKWHVSLYRTSLTGPDGAINTWNTLDTNTPWHVWLVQRIGKGSSATYNWFLIS